MHDTLNVQDWKSFYEKYTSISIEGMSGIFLLRRDRKRNTQKYLNDVAKVYKKCQRKYTQWREENLIPLFENIKERADNDTVYLHAKPTHENDKYQNHDWWIYKYSKRSLRWGYFFDWVEEPEEKLNHDLGQLLYEYTQYETKFQHRETMLKGLLSGALYDYVYSLYDYKWIDENQFSETLVKISLLGDEYWYRIGRNRHGVPVWENFVWQSNTIKEINL